MSEADHTVALLKRIEQALRENESLFHAVAVHASDVLLVLDPNGQVGYASPSCKTVLGYEPAEIEATPIFDLIHSDDRSKAIEATHKAITSGVGQASHYRTRHRSGSWRLLQVYHAALRNPQAALENILMVASDVTETKESDDERKIAQRLAALGQVAVGIVHEISVPLQFIGDNLRFLQRAFTGLTKLLSAYEQGWRGVKERKFDDSLLQEVESALRSVNATFLHAEIPKALQQSMEGLNRMAEVVLTIKEFSHPSSDGIVPVDLNKAVESTLRLTAHEWRHVSEVRLDFEANLPLVPCRFGELSQLIVTMVTGAAAGFLALAEPFSGSKGTVTVSTRRGGDWIEVRVRSDGSFGMPADGAAAVGPDVTSDFARRLEVARSIAADHGGIVVCETLPGAGISYLLRLPTLTKGPISPK